AWRGVVRPHAAPRRLDRGYEVVQEALSGPKTGPCATHPPLRPRQFLFLDGSKRASAPNNRHSRRGLAQAILCAAPMCVTYNNAGLSAWGLHIESSCRMPTMALMTILSRTQLSMIVAPVLVRYKSTKTLTPSMRRATKTECQQRL